MTAMRLKSLARSVIHFSSTLNLNYLEFRKPKISIGGSASELRMARKAWPREHIWLYTLRSGSEKSKLVSNILKQTQTSISSLNFVMFDIISQSANSNLESNSPNSGQASVASSN